MSSTTASAGTDGTTQVASGQQEFSFAAEVRSEALSAFVSRTDSVGRGLSGSRQQAYQATSQKISVHFKFSMRISGSALSGFSKGSEQLQDDIEGAFGKFLDLAQQALGQDDETFNMIFSLLDGFFNGKDGLGNSFNTLFQDAMGSMTSQAGSGTQSQEVQLEFEFSFEGEVQVEEAQVQQSDPITLDMDNDGVELTRYQDGARFDITGRGALAKTAFVTGGDAFLAMDRNGNGVIDSGKELFGDQSGAANGFEELAKLDLNHDKVIDAQDPGFRRLRLFQDNGNGVTEPGELKSLADAGIVTIGLRYQDTSIRAAGGNRIGQVASYRKADGSSGTAADAILNYTA